MYLKRAHPAFLTTLVVLVCKITIFIIIITYMLHMLPVTNFILVLYISLTPNKIYYFQKIVSVRRTLCVFNYRDNYIKWNLLIMEFTI